LLAGIAAQGVTQRLIARGRAASWAADGILFLALVPAILLTTTGLLTWSVESAAIGAAAGVLLYLATQAFLRLTRGWRAFADDTRRLYTLRNALPVPAELGIGAFVAAGEELFWRGLAIVALTEWLGRGPAAVAALVIFVAVNALSGSRPVVAGALVGGSVWTALALWPSAGLVAALVSHAVWTAGMIAAPGFAATPGRGTPRAPSSPSTPAPR
jgi:membrane protease YdiL (CAAX protease family)